MPYGGYGGYGGGYDPRLGPMRPGGGGLMGSLPGGGMALPGGMMPPMGPMGGGGGMMPGGPGMGFTGTPAMQNPFVATPEGGLRGGGGGILDWFKNLPPDVKAQLLGGGMAELGRYFGETRPLIQQRDRQLDLQEQMYQDENERRRQRDEEIRQRRAQGGMY